MEGAETIETSVEVHARIAESWLSAFSEALKARDYDRVMGMMHSDCYWRDLLTFSWDFKTLHGIKPVQVWLQAPMLRWSLWVSPGRSADDRRHW